MILDKRTFSVCAASVFLSITVSAQTGVIDIQKRLDSLSGAFAIQSPAPITSRTTEITGAEHPEYFSRPNAFYILLQLLAVAPRDAVHSQRRSQYLYKDVLSISEEDRLRLEAIVERFRVRDQMLSQQLDELHKSPRLDELDLLVLEQARSKLIVQTKGQAKRELSANTNTALTQFTQRIISKSKIESYEGVAHKPVPDVYNDPCFENPDPNCECDVDGECGVDPPPPNPPSNSCLSYAETNYSSYTDYGVDTANGYFEAWTSTSNMEGKSAKGTIKASLTVTMPDGTVRLKVSGISTSNPTVLISDFFPVAAGDSRTGKAVALNEIDWSCGNVVTVSGTQDFFRIATTNYLYSGPFMNDGCKYTQACGSTKPTCGSPVALPLDAPYVPNCPNYLHQHQLVINGSCTTIGRYERSSVPVACN